MIKYIDCDGVILDTETGLFDRYDELKKSNPTLKRRQYLHDLDWEYWIQQAAVLNDAIALLKSYDPKNVKILTKVHSLNEARVKIEYFRSQGVMNNIVLVPEGIAKSSVVDAKGNVLVEDSRSNLLDWQAYGGIPIYFGTDECDFSTISSLEMVLDDKKFKSLVKK